MRKYLFLITLSLTTIACDAGNNGTFSQTQATPYVCDPRDLPTEEIDTNALRLKPTTSFAEATTASNIFSFLLSNALLTSGATPGFQTNTGQIPLSFAKTNTRFWLEYVCETTTGSLNGQVNPYKCRVIDHPSSDNSDPANPINPRAFKWSGFTGTKQQEIATLLQNERLTVTQGSKIYDVANWQMALGSIDQTKLATGIITTATKINYTNEPLNNLKLVNSKTNSYNYGEPQNYTTIENPEYAYNYNILTRNYLSLDPLISTSTNLSTSVTNHTGSIPEPLLAYCTNKDDNTLAIEGENVNPANETACANFTDTSKLSSTNKGKISWPNFTATTSDNVWASLIGPLQNLFLSKMDSSFVVSTFSFTDNTIQNALTFLWPLQLMQSNLGAFYSRPLANREDLTSENPNAGYISLDDNFAILTGLNILRHILYDLHKGIYKSTITERKSLLMLAQLKSSLNVINIMLYGGETPHGPTKGLLPFLKEYAYDQTDPAYPAFYQGGIVLNDYYENSREVAKRKRTEENFLAKTHLWGILALGPTVIDKWYGDGAAYKIWQTVKQRSGVFNSKQELLGLGYTDNALEKAVSAEVTFHGLFVVQQLITLYGKNPSCAVLQEGLAALKADKASMEAGIINLRTDAYSANANYFVDLLPSMYQNNQDITNNLLGFLESSKRTLIPAPYTEDDHLAFYANPLPSSTATALATLWYLQYNPFTIGGRMESNFFDITTVPEYNSSAYKLAYDTQNVTVVNNVGTSGGNTFNYDAKLKVYLSSGATTGSDPNAQLVVDEIPYGGYRRISYVPTGSITNKNYLVFLYSQNNAAFVNTGCSLQLNSGGNQNLLKQSPIHTKITVKKTTGGNTECTATLEAKSITENEITPYTIPDISELAPVKSE